MVLPVALAFFAMATAGSVNAQVTTPTLGIMLGSTGLTPNPAPGTANAVVATVRLDTTYSSDAIRLNSLPLILSTGNGGNPTSLTSCRIVNEASPTVALNNGTNMPANLISGSNIVTFDTPLVLSRGTVTILDLDCNIAPGATLGGAFQFSLNTFNVNAVAASTGLPASVVVGTGAPVVVPPVFVPGIPNTGLGGNMTQNVILLLGSLLAASFGIAYVRKTSR